VPSRENVGPYDAPTDVTIHVDWVNFNVVENEALSTVVQGKETF
jgi:hypothetical protein